jgi:hypothetical protein
VTLGEPTAQPALPQTRSRDVWRGDVEPIGFPFRLGVLEPLTNMYAFDYSGEWLCAAAGESGLLHAWKMDGSEIEILPRGMLDGAPLRLVQAVVGVAGGFVVGASHHGELVAAHYDFQTRRCTVHRLGPSAGDGGLLRRRANIVSEPDWYYLRELHAVVIRHPVAPDVRYSIDLGADRNFACYRFQEPDAPATKRAQRAAAKALPRRSSRLRIVENEPPHDSEIAAIHLDKETGTIQARLASMAWRAVTPTSDGAPAFQGGRIIEARFSGPTFLVLGENARRQRSLFAFSPLGSSTGCIGEWPVGPNEHTFALDQGQRFARRIAPFELEVREIASSGPARLSTFRAKCHTDLTVRMGDTCLLVEVGRYSHIVRWDGHALTATCVENAKEADKQTRGLFSGNSVKDYHGISIYDNSRFTTGCRIKNLVALLDRFGHVVLLDTNGALVAIFHIFRRNLSRWLPDGTKWGPVFTIGGPPTAGATERIAAAIRDAVRRGGA